MGSNKFVHLMAAVFADILEEDCYDVVVPQLSGPAGLSILREKLQKQGALERAFWICAFSVNQHRGICSANPFHSKDPVTGLEHMTCPCGHEKHFNQTPPLRFDGKGILCQMNKFDDMIAFLAAQDKQFRQVVAVDRDIVLFSRAWCIAELAIAKELGMTQNLMLPSKRTLAHHCNHLRELRIENMQASRPEDVEEIVSKINDVAEFNRSLHELLFGDGALVSSWYKLLDDAQFAKAGHFACLSIAFESNEISFDYPSSFTDTTVEECVVEADRHEMFERSGTLSMGSSSTLVAGMNEHETHASSKSDGSCAM